MINSDHKPHAPERLPSHQIASRCGLFSLISVCLVLAVAAITKMLEFAQLVEDSLKRLITTQPIVLIVLPLIAVVEILVFPPRIRRLLVFKSLLVLVFFLRQAMTPTDASDASESTNFSLVATVFVLCTLASILITNSMTPAQLLDWRANVSVTATVFTVGMVSLYAWGQLNSLTLLGFLVLLLVGLILALWFAFHATKINATKVSRLIVEAGQDV